MRRFLIRTLINAVALWITTIVVAGVHVVPYEDSTTATVVTYLVVAAVFGIVNGTVGNLIRIVAFPVYILTLGLLALLVNSLLLLLVAWLTGLLDFGLRIDSFGWGVVAAIVLGLVSWLLGLVLRPLTRERGRR
jgi:putative membrane protein